MTSSNGLGGLQKTTTTSKTKNDHDEAWHAHETKRPTTIKFPRIAITVNDSFKLLMILKCYLRAQLEKIARNRKMYGFGCMVMANVGSVSKYVFEFGRSDHIVGKKTE